MFEVLDSGSALELFGSRIRKSLPLTGVGNPSAKAKHGFIGVIASFVDVCTEHKGSLGILQLGATVHAIPTLLHDDGTE